MTSLLERQSAKLDLLLDRVTTLEKAKTESGPWLSATEAVVFLTEQPLPLFQSPTSTLFCISFVDTNLRTLECTTGSARGSQEDNPSPPQSSFSILEDEIISEVLPELMDRETDAARINLRRSPTRTESQVLSFIQPLDKLDYGDVLQLLSTYHNLLGVFYPIVNMDQITQYAKQIWAIMAGGSLGDEATDLSLLQIDRNDVAILKMALAIALLAEGESRVYLAQDLYESLYQDIQAMVWNAEIDLKGLVLLTLVVCTVPLVCSWVVGKSLRWVYDRACTTFTAVNGVWPGAFWATSLGSSWSWV
jgi:hypothetical protein